MKVIIKSLLFMITLAVSKAVVPNISQSDESGTLVIAGRSTSGVVISVDSAITGESPVPSVDGTRKLIDVGTNSACAIEGFVGYAPTGNNLARDIREWVRSNPKVEASEGLDDILSIAAGSWNRRGYRLPNLPKKRRVGDGITVIICGTMIKGTPSILVGTTVVSANGRAIVGQHFRTPTDLYMVGTFPAQVFVDLIQRSELPLEVPKASRPAYLAVGRDIRANTLAMKALNSAIVAEDEMKVSSTKSGGKLRFPPSLLDQSNLQTLSRAVYKSVEQHFPEVAPPNNLRIITTCGRLSGTIERPWPTCRRAGNPYIK